VTYRSTMGYTLPRPKGGSPRGSRLDGILSDYGDMLKEIARPWSEAYAAWTDAMRPGSWGGKSHPHGCRCPRCEPDDCHCRCCITNADLVVRARLGERRIVPLVIENSWRREREIELELSSWSPISGETKVVGEILAPTKFTLKGCEERTVVLVVNIEGVGQQGGEVGAHPDVRDCAVSYAELRIVGCDLRAIRIAVAILPRDCDAMRIDCRCGCC
jgi:hypothetical protein